MLNEESKLGKIITELKEIPFSIKDNIVDYAKTPMRRMADSFSRENVVNAIIPKFFARGVNKIFDMLGENNQDTKLNKSGVSPKNTSIEIGGIETDDTETNEDEDAELLEDLIDSIDNGFDTTNQNLVHILMKLGETSDGFSQSSTAHLLQDRMNSNAENYTAKIMNADYKILDITENSNNTLVDLLEVNGKIIKELHSIEKNTRVDLLKQREDEIERRNQNFVSQQLTATGKSVGGDAAKGGKLSNVIDTIADLVLGYAGIKATIGKTGSKILGGIKGSLGYVLQGAKYAQSAKYAQAAKYADIKAITGKTGSNILGGIKGALGSVLQGAKYAGSAALGKIKDSGVVGAIKGVASNPLSPLRSIGLFGTGSIMSTPVSTLELPVPASATRPQSPTNIANLKTPTNVTNLERLTNITAPVAKGGAWQSAKVVGGKLLGAPLSLGLGAYEAYNVNKNENLSSERKTIEYSKIGGKTVGAIAGAKAGAVIGSLGGPIGAAIGGVIGGIGGYFLGESGGEVVGDIINAVAPTSEKNTVDAKAIEKISSSPGMDVIAINNKTSEISSFGSKTPKIDIANVVKPSIDTLTPGQTKAIAFQNLTQQIEQTNAEKQTMKSSPTIVPIAINNQNNVANTSGSQDGSQRQRNSVPVVRNQDGTIQRLLDLNYSPLLRI